jgi:hypothetical protein
MARASSLRFARAELTESWTCLRLADEEVLTHPA